jgi:phenylalanyl-tRNA synthetase beta chain
MKISYNWLRDLIQTKLSPNELAARLTMVGLAVDSVDKRADDYVLEIDLTSNRPDCLSHLGVARELSVIERLSINLPKGKSAPTSKPTNSFTSVQIEDLSSCPRYAARIVHGVTIGQSPDWLINRLEAIGQRPINNVTDITNYVLHELGQPLHAFDLSKLTEHRIVVRRARKGEHIKTLDGTNRALDEEMLVIADATRPVAVAGVMGGEDSEISSTTKDVLIESAFFNPLSVRRTASELNLHTEASYRFERGVDYEGIPRALDRCIELICEIAGGVATDGAVDIYPTAINPPTVSLRPERVASLTSLNVETEEIERILSALGFKHVGDTGTVPVLNFTSPTWRVDIEIEEDLVEEVARHIGYNKLESTLPPANLAGEYQSNERRRRAARNALVYQGYNEAISFSFVDSSYDDLFDYAAMWSREDISTDSLLTLTNPIDEGKARMRPTLLIGLLNAVRHNFNYGTRDVRLFEMGRVFIAGDPRQSDIRPGEQDALAIVATGNAVEAGRAIGLRELDFFDIKGALEAAIDAMNLPPLQFESASIKHLREGQSALIKVGDQVIGTVGRLNDSIASLYKFKQPIYVAEVNLNSLEQHKELVARYSPLAKHPSVIRDVSLLVKRSVPVAQLIHVAGEQKIQYCNSISFVDIYEGVGIPEGMRSVTLRIEYRADNDTLRDEEVDEVNTRMISTFEEQFGAKLRQ